ncbi:MAG: replicative DNA helicase loader DnaI, partial [Clostridiales bacterium]|nr:replicative DNA helicase loader DnaI [Clostridiales bacterium]
FDIINTRELSGKPVVISSNMDTEKMKDDYTERVTSRIRGNYALMKFLGDDIRTIKKMRSI